MTKEELHKETDPEVLLGNRKHPKGWMSMSRYDKLEYIATRMLAEDRHGTTSHAEIKESGILSVSQYERRLSREVYSEIGDLDTIKPIHGTFNRVHVRDIRGVKNINPNEYEDGEVISYIKEEEKDGEG